MNIKYEEFERMVVGKAKEVFEERIEEFLGNVTSYNALMANADVYASYKMFGYELKEKERIPYLYSIAITRGMDRFDTEILDLGIWRLENPYRFVVRVKLPRTFMGALITIEVKRKEDMTEEERKQFERYKQEFLTKYCPKALKKLQEENERLLNIVTEIAKILDEYGLMPED